MEIGGHAFCYYAIGKRFQLLHLFCTDIVSHRKEASKGSFLEFIKGCPICKIHSSRESVLNL